jgi:protoporphyrinogen oxidase
MGTHKVAVLGGGISGVVLAGELARDPRFQVDLIEKTPRLGGLHRSVTLGGAVYDVGPFLFGHNHRLFKTFPEVHDLLVPVHSKYVSITPRGTLDDYPMTLRGYVRANGWPHFAYACLNILYSKVRHVRRHTLTAHVKYYLGSAIYRQSGLKTYIERLYGIPDHEVALEFAQARLSLIANWASLRRTLRRFFARQPTVFTASPVAPGDLVRPPEGFAALYQRLAELLQERGVRVLTDCAIQSVQPSPPSFEVTVKDRPARYDVVVSTIPLGAMARLLGLQGFQDPEYVKLFSLFYRFRGKSGHDATLLHNFTFRGQWKRITTFSGYYGRLEGEEYFVVEGTLKEAVLVDLGHLQADFESHVRDLGLYCGRLQYQGGVLTDYAYPVYRRENLDRVLQMKTRLRAAGLYLAGRQGEFDYISSSDAAGNAQEVAQQICRHCGAETTRAR